MGVSFTLPLAWSRVGPRHNTHIFLRAENREEIFPRVCIAIATPSTPTRASETSARGHFHQEIQHRAAPPFFSAKKWRFREPYPTNRPSEVRPLLTSARGEGEIENPPKYAKPSETSEARVRMNFQYGNEKDPMNGSQFRWEGRVSLHPAELTDKHLFLPYEEERRMSSACAPLSRASSLHRLLKTLPSFAHPICRERE